MKPIFDDELLQAVYEIKAWDETHKRVNGKYFNFTICSKRTGIPVKLLKEVFNKYYK